MATDMGKLQNKENIMLPIIWERDASRGIFKGSTIVLWTILIFVHLNSNMIEMKRSVSRWMSLRKKISDIITFDTKGIGGFLSIMTEHLDDWKIVLTSTRRCPHYTIYTKNLENDNSGQVPFWKYQYWHPSSSSSSSSPHKTIFAVWNYTRNSRTGQKLNKLVQRQIELTTRSTEWKSQQCVKWPETLGESVSVVDANAWAIMHWRSFVFVVSLFCCQLVSLSFDCLPC